MTADQPAQPLDVDEVPAETSACSTREVRFEPGWLKRRVERSVASLDRLPPDIRAALDPPYLTRDRKRPGRPDHPKETAMTTADTILARVADGPVRIGVLADDIARACHIHPDEVVATVWDLIGDDRLDYATDATVRLVR